jgi:hypothetical protein
MDEVGEIDRDMRGKVRPAHSDIAERAGGQHGVIARWQLLDMGFSRYAIDRMIAAGYLHPLHRGVYAVGHRRVSARVATMAAVLSYGSQALASHLSAAWIWDLLRDNRPVTDVSVRGRWGKPRKGIILHRPRSLHPDDIAIRDGIPCTSVARTLLDIAATRPSLLRRAFEEAERRRVLDLRSVHRLLERSQGHRGWARLKAVVESSTAPPRRTRSDLEEAFLDLILAEGLPMPTMNAMIGDYEVDAVWLDERVVVEIDHYSTHGHRTAFERDRIRDAEIQLARVQGAPRDRRPDRGAHRRGRPAAAGAEGLARARRRLAQRLAHAPSGS